MWAGTISRRDLELVPNHRRSVEPRPNRIAAGSEGSTEARPTSLACPVCFRVRRLCDFSADAGFQGLEEGGREAMGLAGGVGADVDGGGADEGFAAVGVHDVGGEGDLDAADFLYPEPHEDTVVEARHAAILEPCLDGRQQDAALHEGAEWMASGAHEFVAGRLQPVEVARVIDVVADGAIAGGDAQVVFEDVGGGHGAAQTE